MTDGEKRSRLTISLNGVLLVVRFALPLGDVRLLPAPVVGAAKTVDVRHFAKCSSSELGLRNARPHFSHEYPRSACIFMCRFRSNLKMNVF
jgi:hypothetical protein